MKNLFFALLALFVVACGGDAPQPQKSIIQNIPLAPPALSAEVKLAPEKYTQQVVVEFKGDEVQLSQLPTGVTAEVVGADVFLRSNLPGVEFVVGGATDRGSLTVVSECSPLLTLDTLSILSVGRDALTVSSKEKIFIRGSVARLADAPGQTAMVDKQAATLSLMGDAVFCDGVEVCLSASRRDAVRSTGIVYIDSARVAVDCAAASAVSAVKGLVLAEGELSATSVKAVVKVKKGNFVMLGGSLVVDATADKADALAARNIYIYGGKASLSVAGAAAKGVKSKESVFLLGGVLDVHTSGGALFSDKKGDYSSSSCIKSSLNTYINNAKVSLVSNGDAGKGINCDGLLQVDGGVLSVKTTGNDVTHPVDLNAHASAKGIKCDSTILVRGGNIEVLVLGKGERCEGIESKHDVIISGADAKVYVCAYDDAVNSGGDFILDDGRVFVYSAANDGIDSNAKVCINGGVLIANGTHTPEQGVDCDIESEYTLRGGLLLSLGGMFGPSPTLPKNRETDVAVVAWCGIDVEDGRYFNVADEAGRVLLSYRLPRSLSGAAVVASSPALVKGDKYSMFMSDSVSGGTAMGCGLYLSGTAPASTLSAAVAWQQKGLLAVIDSKGEALFINPDTVKPMGKGSFPPFDGKTPPPPPNGFPAFGGKMPPPPHGFFEDVPAIEELPCEGWL